MAAMIASPSAHGTNMRRRRRKSASRPAPNSARRSLGHSPGSMIRPFASCSRAPPCSGSGATGLCAMSLSPLATAAGPTTFHASRRCLKTPRQLSASRPSGRWGESSTLLFINNSVVSCWTGSEITTFAKNGIRVVVGVDMSRLDSFIRRMSAQRDCLNYAAAIIGSAPGSVIELGLGNGRTYDHLRELMQGRDIYVFDRHVKAHPDCIPDAEHMIVGDFLETVP